MIPSDDAMVFPSNVTMADCIAAVVQVATLRVQTAFAPSQTIPVMFPMIFCIEDLILPSPPPIKYVIPQHALVAEMVAPHNADKRPKLDLMWMVTRLLRDTAPRLLKLRISFF